MIRSSVGTAAHKHVHECNVPSGQYSVQQMYEHTCSVKILEPEMTKTDMEIEWWCNILVLRSKKLNN